MITHMRLLSTASHIIHYPVRLNENRRWIWGYMWNVQRKLNNALNERNSTQRNVSPAINNTQ